MSKRSSSALDVSYSYDVTGNRTSFTNAGGTQAYAYLTDSHRLTAVGAIPRTYDAAGNTTAIGGTSREFAYNAAGRMSEVQRDNTIAMQYAYSGRGEQVRRHLGGTSTYTLYDEAGHWVGDYDSSGSPIQQAIWLDDLPVGVLAGTAAASNRLHYIEPDHLGTPRAVIEPQRDVAVWSWDIASEAFGNSDPDQDPDGDSAAFAFNMRFPGQRHDAASDLNYNYFRDYEAGTGRYSMSDPVGLKGGISSYSYAASSPMEKVDPSGLMWFGPTCDASQRASIISEIVKLSNEVKGNAEASKNCETGDCDWRLAADVMRWISNEAYFSCNRQGPCAGIWGKGPYVYLYPPFIGAPDTSEISSPGTCGCFRSVLFHEAAHVVRYDLDEDIIRSKTLSCVSCATNVSESGGPL